MATFDCKECSGQVSDQAAACPHCGAPIEACVTQELPPIKSSAFKTIVITAVVLVVLSSLFAPAAPPCAANDLQCAWDKATVDAWVYCKAPVERLAKHTMRWADGDSKSRFSHARWLDAEKGSLTMVGDKAEFQNGFGAFTPVIYECDLDADRKTVLDVRVQEGRLP